VKQVWISCNKRKEKAIEPTINPNPAQYISDSLIEFLLGNGKRPGWLDEQKHHPFARLEARYTPICSSRNENEDRGQTRGSVSWQVWEGGRLIEQGRGHTQDLQTYRF
jgi:hypothetical protein